VSELVFWVSGLVFWVSGLVFGCLDLIFECGFLRYALTVCSSSRSLVALGAVFIAVCSIKFHTGPIGNIYIYIYIYIIGNSIYVFFA